ncbi:uncharacterized protein LOC109818102 isoform X2 [Cajanus cajan]|uniref:uncharacterized protein LOC109818102 isoform X2 n=1 Tax=Cajanus cajan TaxID=3821 RepID=UPI00098DB620|nr:uncharacterized protein LOC109818102 isoform X2 [Cajanus cajan]
MEEQPCGIYSVHVDASNSTGYRVVDGLNTICSVGHTGTIKSIKKCIYGNPHLVIFNYCFSHMSIPMIRYLLTVSICRLSLNNSITGLSSCIIRSLKVCTSEDKVVKVCSLIQTPKFFSAESARKGLYLKNGK